MYTDRHVQAIYGYLVKAAVPVVTCSFLRGNDKKIIRYIDRDF